MKKIVFRCTVDDERAKIRAMKALAGGEGVGSIAVDIREGKITVVGDADPVDLVVRLRKLGFAELVSVGSAKEEKKTLAGEEACMYISYGEEAIKMRKIVFRCAVNDERAKSRAMKALAGLGGVDSVSADTREGKITVFGEADPVSLVTKLRKLGFRAELVSMGPAKEEKKTLAGEEACMYISYGEDAIKMTKMVIKCAFEDEKTKRKAMLTLAQVGVVYVSADVKEMKITVIGEADPVFLAIKLRKLGFKTKFLSVGPAAGKEVSKDQKRDHYSGVQQVVLKSTMEDERSKRRAMNTVAGAGGADSIAVDVKEGKITVIGEVNSENLVLQLRKSGFGTELLSLGPAKYEKEAGKVSAIEEQGRNHYLGVQKMRLNWASEDEESKKRIMVLVAESGDFDSIAVDVKQGMVIVVGKDVPVSVAMKVREYGYRAKLVSVGVGSFP